MVMMANKFIKLILLIGFLSIISASKVQSDEVTLIDPWNFSERASLYGSILQIKVPLIFGENGENDCLFGLPLQLNWQERSGRLNLTLENNGIERIDEFSWWADMNYYLSVIPYLAAMELNLVPQVLIQPPIHINASLFCLTFQHCDEVVMGNWYDFFTLLSNIQSSNESSVEPSDFDVLQSMWKAHTGSIHHAVSLFGAELSMFDSGEERFGFGWANFVEILSIINFNTNYTDVTSMEVALPYRVLKSSDLPPFIPDMSKSENVIVESMFEISDLAKSIYWDGFLLALEEIVTIPKCQYLINSEISSYIKKPINTIIFILKDIIKSCSNA